MGDGPSDLVAGTDGQTRSAKPNLWFTLGSITLCCLLLYVGAGCTRQTAKPVKPGLTVKTLGPVIGSRADIQATTCGIRHAVETSAALLTLKATRGLTTRSYICLLQRTAVSMSESENDSDSILFRRAPATCRLELGSIARRRCPFKSHINLSSVPQGHVAHNRDCPSAHIGAAAPSPFPAWAVDNIGEIGTARSAGHRMQISGYIATYTQRCIALEDLLNRVFYCPYHLRHGMKFIKQEVGHVERVLEELEAGEAT